MREQPGHQYTIQENNSVYRHQSTVSSGIRQKTHQVRRCDSENREEVIDCRRSGPSETPHEFDSTLVLIIPFMPALVGVVFFISPVAELGADPDAEPRATFLSSSPLSS